MSRKRILLVEDEALIVMMLEDILDELGYVCAGHVQSVDEAIAALDAAAEGDTKATMADGANGCDAAIVDVNLGSDQAWPVVDRLVALDIPFILSSGASDDDRPARFADAVSIRKPYSFDQLEQALAGLFAGDESAMTTVP